MDLNSMLGTMKSVLNLLYVDIVFGINRCLVNTFCRWSAIILDYFPI